MSAKGLVSVVLPVHYVNRAWLRQSIESVLQQDYQAKELIVVNDATTEPIDDLIREYGIRKYVVNDGNRKLPYSLNRGFELADGEFHTWTSADNYMLPGMLSSLVIHLTSDPRVSIVFGRSLTLHSDNTFVDDNAQIDRRMTGLTGVSPDDTRISRHYPLFGTLGACFLYRTEVWRALGGYDEALHGAEDYDFWIRAAQRFQIQRLPKRETPHYVYRVHAESVSTMVTGCYTTLRLRILRRHLKCHPLDLHTYRAFGVYLTIWITEKTRALVRAMLGRKRLCPMHS